MRLTKVLRLDVGRAIACGGRESELHLRQVNRGTERHISYNVKSSICICTDAEGRPDRE